MNKNNKITQKKKFNLIQCIFGLKNKIVFGNFVSGAIRAFDYPLSMCQYSTPHKLSNYTEEYKHPIS